MIKTSRFTLLETIVAVFILAVIVDLIFDFFIGARLNNRKNDDSFAMSLALESTVNQLNPQKYSLKDLEEILFREAANNSFQERGITWKAVLQQKSVELRFFRKEKQIFQTELLLP